MNGEKTKYSRPCFQRAAFVLRIFVILASKKSSMNPSAPVSKTVKEYLTVLEECKSLFTAKLKDYGTAWRILRPTSLTDQIYIKAQRIRSFEEKGVQQVEEDIRFEYIGIINYSIIALIQIELGTDESQPLEPEKALEYYDNYAAEALSLMTRKNHDYDEAWRNMRRSSLTDIILMKLLRIKQIEDHQGQTFISEGVDANYFDMINYAIFALIKMNDEIA
jgi:hypothetical protein